VVLDKASEKLLRAIRAAAKEYDWKSAQELSEQLIDCLKDNAIRQPDVFMRELKHALEIFDKPKAKSLCDELVNGIRAGDIGLEEDRALDILGLLRSKRSFGMLEQVADALIQNGLDHPTAWRQYAQSLIEQGSYTAAQQALSAMIDRLPKSHDEYKEACGLMGRLYKQNFVDIATPRNKKAAINLKSAVKAYGDIYKRDKNAMWHGINLVALLCRAKKEKISTRGLPDPKQVAAQLLNKIERNKCPQPWEFATAAAACLALEEDDAALDWIVRYSKDPRSDAFEFGGTLRQFKEIWQLRADKTPGSKILHVLQTALLAREGGEIQLDRNTQSERELRKLGGDKAFEKVLGTDGFVSFKWYSTGIERSKGIALIKDRFQEGQGTGFILRGRDIKEEWGNELFMLTNEHVISNLSGNRTQNSLQPDQARISFELSENPDSEMLISEVMFCSPSSELDATIVKLSQPVTGVIPYTIAKHLPTTGGKQRVYVIGHPKGGKLSLSIHDNVLLDHKAPLVHYRAPTEGGSSGSPVFNSQWDLIALHHAGGFNVSKLNGQGSYPANEGIWIQSILKAVNQ